MKKIARRAVVPALAALAMLVGGAGTTRAAYTITVQEGAGPVIPIVDGGPLDTDLTVNGSITANTALLNLTLTQFSFSNLGGTSNLLFGTPGSTDPASISQTGEVARTDSAGFATVTIQAFDSGFTFPTGNPYVMTTSASDTFRNTTAGDVRTFQSTFDASGAGGGVVNSPLLAFVPPVGTGPFSTSSPGVVTPLGVQPIPFNLLNTTVITLGPNGTGQAIQSDQFTGATTITAVPEPVSLGLLALGLPALVAARRLRRKSA